MCSATMIYFDSSNSPSQLLQIPPLPSPPLPPPGIGERVSTEREQISPYLCPAHCPAPLPPPVVIIVVFPRWKIFKVLQTFFCWCNNDVPTYTPLLLKIGGKSI